MRRTETRHELARGLQSEAPATILARLLQGQQTAVASVASAIPDIARAAGLAASVIEAGGRVGYAGAGSAGLMALADGLEIAGTFGIAPAQVPALLAGGAEALRRMEGAAEDDAASAAAKFHDAGLGVGDAVICVSASGRTPSTLAVAEAARQRGASVVGIANATGSRLLDLADIAILLDTGPELVTGSTRLGAATAQKVALNMLSTLMGTLLGHVHDGHMVNVVADNEKLRDRSARMVAAIALVDEASALAALATCGGAVKPAILLAAGAPDRAAAEALLEKSGGHLGPALDALRG
jgi:N-acetylmuramic acid 6-phosphate etherase